MPSDKSTMVVAGTKAAAVGGDEERERDGVEELHGVDVESEGEWASIQGKLGRKVGRTNTLLALRPLPSNDPTPVPKIKRPKKLARARKFFCLFLLPPPSTSNLNLTCLTTFR